MNNSVFVVRVADLSPVCRCPDASVAAIVADAMGRGFEVRSGSAGERLRWDRTLNIVEAEVVSTTAEVDIQCATGLEFYSGEDVDLEVRRRIEDKGHGDFLRARDFLAMIQASRPQSPSPAAVADVGTIEPSTPALTANDGAVMLAMATQDGSRLLSVADIAGWIDDSKALSERTIGPIVTKLIQLGLAERPEGGRRGARLTLAGRRHASKIAD